MRLLVVLILASLAHRHVANGQESRKYTTSDTYSRGILCLNETIFTSNADGSITRFNWDKPSEDTNFHFGTTELRDITIINNQLFAMESGEKGILHVKDKTSKDTLNQLYSLAPNVFFDGMDNYESTIFLMGDPINGIFSLFTSPDGGQTWRKIDGLKSKEGEAGFAASGTNVQVLNDSTFLFVSGGNSSRFFKSTNGGKNWTIVDLPFQSGNSSAGAFSIHMKNNDFGIVVGGNYELPMENVQNCFITSDGGITWSSPLKNPNGYRSCVIEKNRIWYCCGTNGLDFSTDNGQTWLQLSSTEFFTLTADDYYVYATAKKGLLYRFKLIQP
jgi:hypothetical protein